MENQIEYKGKTIKIWQDVDAGNPRTEWDNFGHMVCFHRRYALGDKHDLKAEDFGGWSRLEEHLKKKMKANIIMPLYLYDHSGITMSTEPFSCPWDSGQVGYIYCTPEDIRKSFMVKRASGLAINKAVNLMKSEVSTYDSYLTGEVYGYSFDGDSCGGYYGYPEGYNQALADATSQIDHILKAVI